MPTAAEIFAARKAEEERKKANAIPVLFDIPAAGRSIAAGAQTAVQNAFNYLPLPTPIGPTTTRQLDAAVKILPQLFGFKPEAAPTQASTVRVAPQAAGDVFGRTMAQTTARNNQRYADMVSPEYAKILQIEGGTDKVGNWRKSPAGAWGPAQLMPGTAPEAMALAGYDRNDTGWQSDGVKNVRAGNAYFNKQLETFGNPLLAAAAYNAGPGAVQKALTKGGPSGWINYLPAETQQYVQKYAGMTSAQMGQVPAYTNPFDPSYGQAQMAQIDQATALASQPFRADISQPAPPKMPDAPVFPTRDFSKTDQAYENMRPVMIDERQQATIKRANLFSGLAKGLASLDDDAGLGQVLGNIGAGLLAGRAQGDMQVQQYMDKFDEQMAAWKQAGMQYEGVKQEAAYKQAVDQVAGMYEHNMKRWAAETDQFRRDNTVTMQGTHIVVTNRTNTGMAIETIPIMPAIKAAGALQKAQVLGAMANDNNQGAMLQGQATNQYLTGMALSQIKQGAEAGTAEVANAQDAKVLINNTVMQARTMLDGGFGPGVLGQESFSALQEQAAKLALAGGATPGTKEFIESQTTYMAGLLTQEMINNKALAARVQQQLPLLFQEQQRQQYLNRKVTKKTDAKGTSVTESY